MPQKRESAYQVEAGAATKQLPAKKLDLLHLSKYSELVKEVKFGQDIPTASNKSGTRSDKKLLSDVPLC